MPTITEIAAGSPDFSILVAALGYVDTELSTDLIPTLDDDTQSLTVFAPNNAAFGQLAADLGFTGDVTDADAVTGFIVGALPAETIRDVLLYHVAAGSLTVADVQSAGTVSTLLSLDFVSDGPTLVDLEPDLIDPSITTGDVAADNGIVHIIDRVLLPIDVAGNDASSLAGIVAASGTDFDTDASDFDMLLAAATAAELVAALDDPTADLTVFAPNDGAFIDLAQTLGYAGDDEAGAFGYIVRGLTLLGGGDPIPLLTQVLLYHVAGESLQASQVLSADQIETLQGGALTVSGATLQDAEPDIADPSIIATDIQASNGIAHVIDGVLLPADLLVSDGANDVDFLFGTAADDTFDTGADADFVDADAGDDTVLAGVGNDTVLGGLGNDRLIGDDGDDLLRGGDGVDTLNGGDGNDIIFGGDSDADLSDTVYAGSGDDTVDAGYGNDTVFGMDGNDTITGGFGADHLQGQNGDDVIAGNALSDELFGNAGDDFLNGGFGSDRLNGGDGADKFYHLGVASHGSDWIQDFDTAEGDVLVFGQSGASVDDFVVHFNDTTNSSGERAGEDDVQEVFVDYQGQTLWALVDGAGQSSLNIVLDGTSYDLLA